MYVKKYFSDSLEGALQRIKEEMGPDAIILKTVTHKGLVGKFKKNRIEITAAIKTKDYESKQSVDQKLGDEEKNNFYHNDSNHISKMIDKYKEEAPSKASTGSKIDQEHSDTLDNFISENQYPSKLKDNQFENFISESESTNTVENAVYAKAQTPTIPPVPNNKIIPSQKIRDEIASDKERPENYQKTNPRIEHSLKNHEIKLKELEEELTNIKINNQFSEDQNLQALYRYLSGLSIDQIYLNKLIKDISKRKDGDEIDGEQDYFEYAAKKLWKDLNIDEPLFIKNKDKQSPRVILLLSEGSSGQTTTALKLSKFIKSPEVFLYDQFSKDMRIEEITKILGLKLRVSNDPDDVFKILREKLEKEKNLIIDVNTMKIRHQVKDYVRKIKECYSNVEILLCLSSIHSEKYNKKMVALYSEISDGVVLNHLDGCLCFGSIFNLSQDLQKCPIVLYGTGPGMPLDLEIATKGKIIDGLFSNS